MRRKLIAVRRSRFAKSYVAGVRMIGLSRDAPLRRAKNEQRTVLRSRRDLNVRIRIPPEERNPCQPVFSFNRPPHARRIIVR